MRQLREIHVRAIDLEELGVVICNHGYVEDEELRKQYKHNARLIVTAHYLLESLQVMRALVRIKYGNLYPDVNVEIEKADAAIRKALGEEE